jgi:hypothetical protein
MYFYWPGFSPGAFVILHQCGQIEHSFDQWAIAYFVQFFFLITKVAKLHFGIAFLGDFFTSSSGHPILHFYIDWKHILRRRIKSKLLF